MNWSAEIVREPSKEHTGFQKAATERRNVTITVASRTPRRLAYFALRPLFACAIA